MNTEYHKKKLIEYLDAIARKDISGSMDNTEDAITELSEIVALQDDAICELSELIGGEIG